MSGQERCPSWGGHSGLTLVPSAEGHPDRDKTCSLSELLQAQWGLLPGASGCGSQRAVSRAGAERGAGSRGLKERDTGSGHPEPLLAARSRRPLSLAGSSNRAHFIGPFVIASDSAPLSSTPWKVSVRW